MPVIKNNFFHRRQKMKKITALFAVAFAAALWFTGCEQGLEFARPSESSASFERSAAISIIPGASGGGTQIGGSALNAAPGAPDKWTAITDPGFTNTFNEASIWAVSVVGKNVVAGGDKGLAAYSLDGGETWTALPDNITQGNTINGIANNGDETFVMVAFGGVLAYTTNGPAGTWTTLGPAETRISETIYAAAYGTRSGRFVIGGGYGQAAYSDNLGKTWTAITDLQSIFVTSTISTNIRAISYVYSLNDDADIFVAVGGRSGDPPMPNAAAFSVSNGNNGSWAANPNGVFCRGLTSDGKTTFVASGWDMGDPGDNIAYMSISSIKSWKLLPSTTTGVSGWLNCIAYGAGYYVAGGLKGSLTYANSPTGTWTYVNLSNIFTGYINGLSYGASDYGNRFFAVGDNGKGAYTSSVISVITETVGATGNGSGGISVNVN
jgi:hypothetical protein